MPIPVDYFCWGSARFETGPSLVLAPESRSGCFPAVPCPPLRPLVVYLVPAVLRKTETKKLLIIAALSDMANNGFQIGALLALQPLADSTST